MVLTGLETGAQYEVRLRAMNKQGWSSLSDSFYFTTAGINVDIEVKLEESVIDISSFPVSLIYIYNESHSLLKVNG